MRQGNYVKAREMFAALGDYSDANRQATRADTAEKKRLKDEQDRRDAEERARKDKYQRAENLIEIKQYDSAIRLFDELGYYSDARTKSNQLRMLEREYKSAKASLEKQHWTEAERFLKKLGDYRDSAVLLASISQIKARAEIEALVRGKRELEGYRDTLDEIKRLSNDGSVFGGILGLTWVFALLALGGVILGASGSSEWLVGFFPSLLFLLAWIACLVAFLVKRASAKANADRVEELRKQLPMFIPAVPETKKPNSTNTDRPMLNRKNLDEEIGTLQAKIDKLKARQLH